MRKIILTLLGFACLLLCQTAVYANQLDHSLSYNEARRSFQTQLIYDNYKPDGEAPEPPPELYNKIHYLAENGGLVAYVSPDPGDNKKHPILIWARGGHGGIGDWLWAKDEELYNAIQRGLLVMTPSWRQDNTNPGRYSLFFGEVEDALAAIEYVKTLDYVDPNRIYMAGHSTGGTMTLLTAIASSDIRAAFSFGGVPDMIKRTANGNYGREPYDYQNEDESYIRSAIKYVHELKTPTFYFEGTSYSSYVAMAKEMESLAATHNTPFSAYPIERSDHSKHIIPIMDLVVDKILADTGETASISFSQEEVQDAFDEAYPPTNFAQLMEMEQDAEQGGPYTQYELAQLYWDEEELKGLANDERALYWLKAAAKNGHTDAAYEVAHMYYKGNGVAEDEEIACEFYKKSAELGHKWGQYYTARCYRYGTLFPKDDKVAAEWYLKSAEQGDEDAMYELGLFYEYGRGVPKSDEEAFKWYKLSADAGHIKGMNATGLAYENGTGTPKSPKDALKYYQLAAEENYNWAFYYLGDAYGYGTLEPAVQKDLKQAFEWYKKAAELDNIDAMLELGKFYTHGQGTAVNKEKAFHWHLKAAELENTEAMRNVGLNYYFGQGTPVNKKQAFHWFQKAGADYPVAIYNMTLMASKGDDVEQNLELAQQGFQQLLRYESKTGQYYLALAHLNGYGTERDADKGLEMLSDLSKAGYQPAIDMLPNAQVQTITKSKAFSFFGIKLKHFLFFILFIVYFAAAILSLRLAAYLFSLDTSWPATFKLFGLYALITLVGLSIPAGFILYPIATAWVHKCRVFKSIAYSILVAFCYGLVLTGIGHIAQMSIDSDLLHPFIEISLKPLAALK